MTACFNRRTFVGLLLAGGRVASGAPASSAANPVVQAALARMYNCDFAAADRILDRYIHDQPEDSLGYCFRAASILFRELDRLMILEGEFFSDDKRIIEKKKLQADPEARRQFFEYIEMGRRRAQTRLAAKPQDLDSLFGLSISAGLVTDYVGLIERKQLGSLQYAKESHMYAIQLLKLDPMFTDAYMTTGLTEYLLGSVPFFVRWFLKFDEAEGDKKKAVRNLELVVKDGRYLGPFAKILLCIIHLREKRKAECERLLKELVRDFPDNPLLRKELAKVSALRN